MNPRLTALLGLGLSLATPLPSQAYPIDCAILLCLSGGWPSSVECSLARAEFIRRITPWPVEPPLQIWNCPMHAELMAPRFREQLIKVGGISASAPDQSVGAENRPSFLQQVRLQADLDISGAAFDFVRSIHVFEIRYLMGENSDGDCNRWSSVFYGSYGTQGEYQRVRSTPGAIPEASEFAIPANCPTFSYRAVFVEWTDAQGTYGSEEVPY